jgi:DNA-binding transcriptional LysR family regulator
MAMPAQRHLPATETNHRQHSLVEWNSTVIVGVPHTLRYDANIILKRFQKLHPNTRVVVREYSEDECFVQLASGKVHLVLSERSISEKEAEAMTRINRDVAQMILPIGVQSDKQNGQFLHMTAWGDALRCQSALNAFVNCSRTVARKQFAEIEVAWVAEPLRTQN